MNLKGKLAQVFPPSGIGHRHYNPAPLLCYFQRSFSGVQLNHNASQSGVEETYCNGAPSEQARNVVSKLTVIC